MNKIHKEILSLGRICPHCGRNETDCEANTNLMKNPITYWLGWGLSCDECYYKNHPESDDDDEEEDDDDEELCSSCGEVNKCNHQDIYKEYKFCDTCNETKRIIDDHNVECILTTDEGCAVMEEHCIECGFRECECYH